MFLHRVRKTKFTRTMRAPTRRFVRMVPNDQHDKCKKNALLTPSIKKTCDIIELSNDNCVLNLAH